MRVLAAVVLPQAALEYGSMTSSGPSAIVQRIEGIGSWLTTQLDGLLAIAMASPALTVLAAALVCLIVIVRSANLR